ncbi:MAG: GNAT family N-acetyltransferase [Oscillospiraceae bacterium]|jgi:predicted N-acetyltransferase YhbS|nr:GNAT family N-acetyltransferase [Oscillospiraceae bacterium]
MTELLCKGTANDREDILDFANYVFSFDHEPHNFIEMVPRLYGPESASEAFHYLIRENGKIKAMVCSYPMETKVGEETLKLAFIGTVSVHPYSRGKGYMKRLMNAAIADMQKDGTDLAALGGQRQRYQYFGFENGGIEYGFSFNRSNLRHAFKDVASPIKVVPLDEMGKEQWDCAYSLFQRQHIHGIRNREEFPAILHNWNGIPYALLADGEMKGYFSVGGKTFFEFVLGNEAELLPAVKSAMESLHMDRAVLKAADYEEKRLSLLSSVCENSSIVCSSNYRIFHYDRVISAYLKVKQSCSTLQEGSIILNIDGKQTAVEVRDGKITVGPVSPHLSAPVISLGNLEAVEFLTAPFSPRRREEARRFPFLQSWFPIPLYTASLDEC